jgi:oxygen-independent coproporphyrinogen-3 oxidase
MPADWLARTLSVPGGAEQTERLTPEARASEYLMFALRLREGALLSRFADLAGQPLSNEALEDVLSLGLMEQDGDSIRTTDRGIMMLNAILRRLLADRSSA